MAEQASNGRNNYQVGQPVIIIDGPFANFEGVIEAIDQADGKVRVLVSFFGKKTTPVKLDFSQIARLMA